MAKKKAAKPKVKKKEKLKHILVPEHQKLSREEADALFKRYNITQSELPKIYLKDPAIRHLDVKEGDVIKITRRSPTSGESVYYRVVIDE